jgi:hypothetical protein
MEEIKLFRVVDWLVEKFLSGLLPIGHGSAGGRLYQYWKQQSTRLTEQERRNLYGRTFGLPGGDSGPEPNLAFGDLWTRFLAAVSENRGQSEWSQEVWKTGGELARNLSLYGFGVAYFAAQELQTQIRDMIAILSETEIKAVYGARDMWTVMEQVSSLELGGAVNLIRYRTMATSGMEVIAWLSKHRKKLSGGGVTHSRPIDQNLIDACDAWLIAAANLDETDQVDRNE